MTEHWLLTLYTLRQNILFGNLNNMSNIVNLCNSKHQQFIVCMIEDIVFD